MPILEWVRWCWEIQAGTHPRHFIHCSLRHRLLHKARVLILGPDRGSNFLRGQNFAELHPLNHRVTKSLWYHYSWGLLWMFMLFFPLKPISCLRMWPSLNLPYTSDCHSVPFYVWCSFLWGAAQHFNTWTECKLIKSGIPHVRLFIATESHTCWRSHWPYRNIRIVQLHTHLFWQTIWAIWMVGKGDHSHFPLKNTVQRS